MKGFILRLLHFLHLIIGKIKTITRFRIKTKVEYAGFPIVPQLGHFLRALRQVYPVVEPSLWRCKKVYYGTLVLIFLAQVVVAQGFECPAPADFNLLTPCYVNGSRADNPIEDVLILFNHTAARGTSATKHVVAQYSEVGTVWGLAWRAQTKKLYAAAFLKRHSDISPDGLGAIYEIDLTTPTTAGAGTPTLWMDLNSVTHLGAGATLFPTETAANRGLGPKNSPSRDVWAYTRVGKQGLGDIDITEDGTTMYVMDLTNRQVLQIDMATKTVTNRYPINAPANYAHADDRRPFGIKHYNGDLYIGLVSSGETDGLKRDLRANVMKLSGMSFTSVFEVNDMAIPNPGDPTNNGQVDSYRGYPNAGTGLGWGHYSDADMAIGYPDNNPYNYIQNPVPLVSDIEFDNAGNIVIGILDWSGHRMGGFNYRPFPTTPTEQTALYNIQSHGDVVRALKSGATWVNEPIIGGFYNDMESVPQFGFQDDVFKGGMIVTDCNGTELVVANMQDPFTTSEGGTVWMKTSDGLMQTNNTGARIVPGPAGYAIAEGSRVRIYQSQDAVPSTFGKAAGLGDIVAMFNPPCALTPADLTLAGLTFGPGSAPMPETVTTDGGGFLLPESNVAGFYDAASSEGPLYTFCTEISQPILPLQNPYTHVYNGSANAFSAVVALRIAQVVQAAGFNSTMGFGPGNNTVVNFVALQMAVWNAIYDTDYSVSSGAGTFYSTTDANGALATANGWLATAQTITAPTVVVHELHNATGQDLLKVGNPPSTITVAVTPPTCSTGGILTVSGFTNQRYQYSPGMAFNAGSATPASITAIPAGGVITNTLPNTAQNYTVRIYDATDDNCYVDQVVTVTPVSCPCVLTLTPKVSGCYQNGGSKSTVSVEVSWAYITVSPIANDASDQITVTFGGQTKYINPGAYTSTGGNGTIVSPQVVAFEVNADASIQTAQVFIGANYAAAICKAQQTGIPVPAACSPTVCASGQTGGTVFFDYNADGVQQPGETSGLSGITVHAYDCNGNLVGTTTTDVDGNYVFTSIPSGSYPIRVEFSGLPTVYSQGTTNGIDGRTTVQFVVAADCNVDLGVLNPNDYCQDNPKIVMPCYIVGDPQHPGSATDAALVGVNYDLTGGNTYYATVLQLGTVWGTAYKKSNNTVYSAAFVKRHSGLGPDGLGAIYQTNIGSNTTSLFANVTSLGVNLGTMGSNAARGLGAKTAPNADPEAFAKVGKVGMGDLDISEDGSTLYFVNLFERKLHSVNIANPTSAPGVTIPNPGCNGNEFRPWALKVYQGKVYVGVVCDASTSQSKSDLRAYVYTYDIAAGAFNPAPVFDFPLTYPKGEPNTGYGKQGWFPWQDDFSTLVAAGFVYSTPGYDDVILYPVPMLSDIEFDIDGSMVLGFADRTGMQLGNVQLGVNGTGSYSNAVGGDVLRAYFKGGVYVLENNATAGPASGYGPNNNQGPGFGEFYNDDYFGGANLVHSENAQGALAIRPGSGETVYTAMDAVNNIGASGGFRKVSNTSGLVNGAYNVVNGGFLSGGFFAKAQSLGDVELSCSAPTYLQIGNYVWIDTDKDGVQDPCESPLPGVSVSLYKIVAGTPTLVAVTTTGANGEYYFTNNTTAGETWLNGATGLLPNMDYKIVFGYDGQTNTAQYAANNLTIGGNDYILTALNVGAGANLDLNDSDASLMAIAGGSYPSIDVTTGAVGTVNHTYDAGFWFCQDISNASAEQRICKGNTGSDITVQTTSNAASSIRFVRFTTDQMAGSVPSAAEALAIYSGATIGAAVTPTGIAPYTATLTASVAGWSTQPPGTYYVYAILNTDQGASCRPVLEIIVTIVDLPVITTTPGNICLGATVNLATLVTGNTPTGALTYYTSSAAANAGSGALANTTVAPPATTTYYVRSQTTSVCYSIAPITVNVNTAPDFSVTNGSVCQGGSIDLAPLVTNIGGATLTYHTTPAAAQSGAPALASSTVSPAGATNYYVRSINGSGCYTVKELTVTLQAANCGTIQITGPTNN